MLVVGLYGEGSTLRYGELAGVVGPVLADACPGGLVTSIWVDDERSLAGGRQVWGLPKQLATLRWRPGALDVRDAAGEPIVHARWREPCVHVPVPAAAPFIAVLDGAVRRAWLSGRLHVAPSRIELDIPAGSPLACRSTDAASGSSDGSTRKPAPLTMSPPANPARPARRER